MELLLFQLQSCEVCPKSWEFTDHFQVQYWIVCYKSQKNKNTNLLFIFFSQGKAGKMENVGVILVFLTAGMHTNLCYQKKFELPSLFIVTQASFLQHKVIFNV